MLNSLRLARIFCNPPGLSRTGEKASGSNGTFLSARVLSSVISCERRNPAGLVPAVLSDFAEHQAMSKDELTGVMLKNGGCFTCEHLTWEWSEQAV